MMPMPTAVGPLSGCPRKRNGRRQPADQMVANFRGAMRGQPAKPRILENAVIGRAMPYCLLWEAWKREKVRMGYMIWQAMCMNGFRTGMERSITVTARIGTPKALQQENIRSFAEQHGIRRASLT